MLSWQHNLQHIIWCYDIDNIWQESSAHFPLSPLVAVLEDKWPLSENKVKLCAPNLKR